MICLDADIAAKNGKKYIPIRDASQGYATAFYLEDGKNMTVTHSDGFSHKEKCQYIDPYHFYFGSVCYHIDQFAELVKKNNLRCEPEAYITDPNLYQKVYLDRTLLDPDKKPIPYRAILRKELDDLQLQIVGVCPNTQIDRQVCFHNGYDENGPRRSFCSVDQALSELLPALDISSHERNLLSSVLYEMGKAIPRITQQEFDAIPKDYKGVYQNLDGKHPEWEGKRTAFLPGHGTTLFIEDVSFLIDSGKKPALSNRVKEAKEKNAVLDAANQKQTPTQPQR